MLEELNELYVNSGFWAHPILLTTIILLIAGNIMLFTVRLVKKFVLYSLLAILLPNSIGIVGYLEEADNLKEAIMERGAAMKEEMLEQAEDLTFSPVYLGLLGSGLSLVVGAVGIAKLRLSGRKESSSDQTPST